MSNPTIHGKSRPVTASAIREALGDALGHIRAEERLTWVQLGELLNKSDDQVAKYCDGSAEMPITTFYRAKELWNGRFTGQADKLVEDARGEADPREAEASILKAALALSVALRDGKLTNAEIAQNRTALCEAKDCIEALLGRLTPRSAA